MQIYKVSETSIVLVPKETKIEIIPGEIRWTDSEVILTTRAAFSLTEQKIVPLSLCSLFKKEAHHI